MENSIANVTTRDKVKSQPTGTLAANDEAVARQDTSVSCPLLEILCNHICTRTARVRPRGVPFLTHDEPFRPPPKQRVISGITA